MEKISHISEIEAHNKGLEKFPVLTRNGRYGSFDLNYNKRRKFETGFTYGFERAIEIVNEMIRKKLDELYDILPDANAIEVLKMTADRKDITATASYVQLEMLLEELKNMMR